MAEGVWPLPFWSEDVYGPANYQSWLCWASIYATESQLQSCDKLYSIGHRSEADGYGEPLPTSFPDGRRFIVPCSRDAQPQIASDVATEPADGGGIGSDLGRRWVA